jgi:predicted phage tail protein
MVEVRLHGALAAQFGRVWHFDIQTPREAVDAIEAARKGFRKAIMELDRLGMVFRVRTKNHDYDDDDVNTSLGRINRVDIIPIVRGASAGVRFVIGAVLTAIALVNPLAAPYLLPAGLGLMLGAVTEWLTPTPKRDSEVNNAQSWTISGPTNTTEQGVPVPIIYGEVLTGSVPISAGLSASDLAPSGALTPFVTIGGQRDLSFWAGNAIGTYTLVFSFGAGPFNFVEPYTYAWSRTGFALASAVRLFGANTASFRLEVDYTVNTPGDTFSDTGNVALTMTGKDNPTENNTVTPSTNVNCTAFVSSQGYESP